MVGLVNDWVGGWMDGRKDVRADGRTDNVFVSRVQLLRSNNNK